jgi:hypothetical protein
LDRDRRGDRIAAYRRRFPSSTATLELDPSFLNCGKIFLAFLIRPSIE